MRISNTTKTSVENEIHINENELDFAKNVLDNLKGPNQNEMKSFIYLYVKNYSFYTSPTFIIEKKYFE